MTAVAVAVDFDGLQEEPPSSAVVHQVTGDSLACVDT